eukprot:1160371-Pelagomonas_calceolata.AAC.4
MYDPTPWAREEGGATEAGLPQMKVTRKSVYCAWPCDSHSSELAARMVQRLCRGRLEGGATEAGLPQIEVTRTSISHPYKYVVKALQSWARSAGFAWLDAPI